LNYIISGSERATRYILVILSRAGAFRPYLKGVITLNNPTTTQMRCSARDEIWTISHWLCAVRPSKTVRYVTPNCIYLVLRDAKARGRHDMPEVQGRRFAKVPLETNTSTSTRDWLTLRRPRAGVLWACLDARLLPKYRAWKSCNVALLSFEFGGW
jgi:hypothetical protein